MQENNYMLNKLVLKIFQGILKIKKLLIKKAKERSLPFAFSANSYHSPLALRLKCQASQPRNRRPWPTFM